MRIAAAFGIFLALATCNHVKLAGDGLVGYGAAPIADPRAVCEKSGGSYGRGGLSGGMVCYHQTDDANRACSAGTDCHGECLARSRTCSPVIPLLGCNDILLNSGVLATLCVE